MRSSGEGVWTSRKRFTGVCPDCEPVHVRGTPRSNRLECYELVVATGEGSNNRESRFIIKLQDQS